MSANQTTTNLSIHQPDHLKPIPINVTAWGTAPPSCVRESLRHTYLNISNTR
jgi:hypothetical protein